MGFLKDEAESFDGDAMMLGESNFTKLMSSALLFITWKMELPWSKPIPYSYVLPA